MRSDLVDLMLQLKHETPAAILVSDGDREVWLPKSQVEFETTPKPGIVIVTLPQWLAEERELV